MQLPDLFLKRLERIAPPDRLDGVVRSFTESLWTGFRVNPLAGGTGDVVHDLGLTSVEALSWLPGGYVAGPADRSRLLDSPAVRDGRLWVQNPSSMIPPVVLAPGVGDAVLDLAAAPGSKTLQLAGMMGGDADIAAVEPVKGRFYRLKRNLRSHGAAFVKTFNKDGMKVWHYRPDHFDRVLLDAPCSTEGGFRAGDPDTFSHWSLKKVRTMAGKQRRLLESALRAVKPGGLVVYSTCSFAPEENEAVVQHALDCFGDSVCVEPIALDLPGRQAGLAEWEGQEFAPEVTESVRILPDARYEAFFVCRIRRLE